MKNNPFIVVLVCLESSAILASFNGSVSESRQLNDNRKQSYNRRPNDEKIVGGSVVESMADFKFMVSVQILDEHHCSGSLLSMSFVLSACHCFANVPELHPGKASPRYEIDLEAWRFVAGSKTLEPLEKSGQVRKARSVHHHPKCANVEAIIYDLGLGVTARPFGRSPVVESIQMFSWDPERLAEKFQSISEGKEAPYCVVAGWGDTVRRKEDESSESSNDLKYVQMYLIPDDACIKAYQILEKDTHAYDNFSFAHFGQVCAVSKHFDSSDCSGDSGGPYFCGDRIVGTVSYGVTCGTKDPSVYQTVSVLPDWIRQDFPGLHEPNAPEMYPSEEDSPKEHRGIHESTASERRNLVLIIVPSLIGYVWANLT